MNNKDRLIQDLAEALRPFAEELPAGYQIGVPDTTIVGFWGGNGITVSMVRKAVDTMEDFDVRDGAKPQGAGIGPLPWDPASACEVPVDGMDIPHGQREEVETGDPGHACKVDQEAERDRRARARRTAKMMLLDYFKKLHHASGLKWSSDHVIGIGEIVDAILTAAGA